MKKLFLAWSKFPIGSLEYDGQEYSFYYINGVKKAQKECNFQLLHSFPDLNRIYRSPTLFPLFSNRLMKPSRPDYKSYIQWLNIFQPEDEEPMVILARSGGHKATDTLEVFPCPEPINGLYQFYFFVGSSGPYCPSYLLEDISELVEVTVQIIKINPPPAPSRYRLLCKMTAPWKEGFKPFKGADYRLYQSHEV